MHQIILMDPAVQFLLVDPWVAFTMRAGIILGLIGFLVFCYAVLSDDRSFVSPQAKRIAVAACIAVVVATARVRTVEFVPWWPCTADNWQWMIDNLTYCGAIWMWYGVYGCS